MHHLVGLRPMRERSAALCGHLNKIEKDIGL
jgi:signal transduction histidine kinase